MQILVTGGAGDVGRYLVQDLCYHGHQVRVLDRALSFLDNPVSSQVNLFGGDLADKELVTRAVDGAEAVIHLAWSFSDDPLDIFGGDLVGHINLLTASAKAGISHFIYTSTATVYGRATSRPVLEDHPCLVGEARKPLYALGKFAAEELCRQYYREQGLPVTIFRFWWAFGEEIGGRHLRNLIRAALHDDPIQVPAAAGGTFVSMADLALACRLALSRPGAAGQTYNLGSLYLTWEEIASRIIELTGSGSKLQVVPPGEWKGPVFLNEVWELSWDKASRELDYQPVFTGDQGRKAFVKALAKCINKVRATEKKH
ncbi:NAD-dependent epimerase/dehydratase family protein [Moorella sp. ACPs]|uniref:NAD-dependent epimerase/dehydratase family protein n=1 Tax=Neomoorella carbonis TaxID=3062783 RepID=UPI003254245F